ncbi:putative ORFan [Tupanvirus deep ocean]|uniref:ORFan n=2 Tax=Tupanvirus TaxID=2094720 RepID=A0AC62A9K4_9VIRU|nr:putative ORFan [Tupanvirus deep ocean]QKU34404.1 putative ORFan [Tupanvirus deep ocean]
MCLRCHQSMSNEQVENDLANTQSDPKFEVWNATSLSHLTIAAFGLNGPTAQKYAMELFEKYIEYKKNHPNGNDDTFFGSPSHTSAKKQLDKINQFVKISNDNKLTDKDIRTMIYHGDSEEGQKIYQLFANIEPLFDMVQ